MPCTILSFIPISAAISADVLPASHRRLILFSVGVICFTFLPAIRRWMSLRMSSPPESTAVQELRRCRGCEGTNHRRVERSRSLLSRAVPSFAGRTLETGVACESLHWLPLLYPPLRLCRACGCLPHLQYPTDDRQRKGPCRNPTPTLPRGSYAAVLGKKSPKTTVPVAPVG